MKTKTAAAISFLLFAALLTLYSFTAAPDVTFHDSGELITAAWTLGIPHPPGSPTWCLMAHLFTKIPIGTPAYRVHLMSGFFAALTCALVYLFVLRLLQGTSQALPDRWRHAAGLFSALALALCPAFWEKAVQAELYTLNAFFMALILYLFLLWDQKGGQDKGTLCWISFIFGIGAGNYLALLYFAPVIAVAAICRKPGILKDIRLLAGMTAVFAAGCSVYLYLPLRSMADPPIDWGNPETMGNFLAVLKRDFWGDLSLNLISRPAAALWLDSLSFREQTGLLILFFSVCGLFFIGRKKILMTMTLAAFFYAYAILMMIFQAATPALARNMTYYASYGLEEFHIPLYLIIALFAGTGFYAAVSHPHLQEAFRGRARAMEATALFLVLLYFGWDFSARFDACNYRRYDQPRKYGEILLGRIPEGGWIVANTDNSLFILCYLKYCAAIRPDVSIIVPSPSLRERVSSLPASLTAGDMNDAFVRLVRSDPERFLLPVLNQGLTDDGKVPAVAFVKLDDTLGTPLRFFPDGILFALRGRDGYVKESQLAMWQELLSRKDFLPGRGSKTDFTNNMVQPLHDHAWWHMANGEYDLSGYLYPQAIRYSSKGDPELFSGAARSMLGLKQFKEAFEYGQSALDLAPDNIVALHTLGVVHAASRNYPLAEQYFRRVLEIDPENTDARKNLEIVRQKAGEDRHKDNPPARPGFRFE